MAVLACIPSAIPANEREAHFALARRLLKDMTKERQPLPNGFAFRFDIDALEPVARFVANERKCCPFVDFDIRVEHDGGPVWLRMAGPEGTREVLAAAMQPASDCC
jgi:hypothetical protein